MTNVEGRRPEGAPERSPKAGEGAALGVDGNVAKRFSVQRKMAVVERLLRGEPLELVARETNVSIARLSEWRERAFAGAGRPRGRTRTSAAALVKSKVRQRSSGATFRRGLTWHSVALSALVSCSAASMKAERSGWLSTMSVN
jgi:hypothetical protein